MWKMTRLFGRSDPTWIAVWYFLEHSAFFLRFSVSVENREHDREFECKNWGYILAPMAVPHFKSNSSKYMKAKFKLGSKTKMQKGGATAQTPRTHPYVRLLVGKQLLIGLNRWTWAYVLSRDEDRIVQNSKMLHEFDSEVPEKGLLGRWN